MFTSFAVILFALFTCAISKRYHVDDEKVHRAIFTQYKKDFSKSYHLHEEESIFRVFESNLKLIDERNARELAAGGEECHGLTKFMDMTQEEFNKLNGFKLPEEYVMPDVAMDKVSIDKRRRLSEINADKVPVMHRNWIGKLTTPVKHQQQCGSCWAFSASEQLESMVMKEHGIRLVLSPAQMVQCSPGMGCDGGFVSQALYIASAVGGLSLDQQYPYDEMASGNTGVCQANKISPVVTPTSVIQLNTNYTDSSNDWLASVEKSMAEYVLGTAPLAVSVDAEAWSTYTGGVMTVCGTDINHAAQIVGINLEAETPYWIIRNSWGDNFGEAGYLRLRYGENLCALTFTPTSVHTSLSDITAAFEL